MKYCTLTAVILISVCTSIAQTVKKVMIEGNSVPLVFLHGATTNMTGLDKATKALAPDFRVIRMQSFNSQYAEENRILPENYSIRMESDGIGYTLDSLKVTTPIILVGSSYGGLIALDYALHHPERIQSLILLEPVVFGLSSVCKERPDGYDQNEKVSQALKPTAVITEELVKAFRCLQVNCDSVDIKKLPQWKTWLEQGNRLRGLSAAFEYKIDDASLKNFTAPVLIVTGTQTSFLNKRIDELLNEAFPHSELRYIVSGHSIPSMAPQELAVMINDFLKK